MSVPDEDAAEDGKKKQRGDGYEGNFRKAKRVVLLRLAKLKKRLLSKKSGGGGGGMSGGGCLCFTKPLTGESSFRSNTSDPNDPNFSYDMLKAMIEQNDFYSRECNPHLYSN